MENKQKQLPGFLLEVIYRIGSFKTSISQNL